MINDKEIWGYATEALNGADLETIQSFPLELLEDAINELNLSIQSRLEYLCNAYGSREFVRQEIKRRESELTSKSSTESNLKETLESEGLIFKIEKNIKPQQDKLVVGENDDAENPSWTRFDDMTQEEIKKAQESVTFDLPPRMRSMCD